MTPNALPPPIQLWNLAAGHMVSSVIQVAARLGIADLLAGGPKSVEALATSTETHAPTLHRVLRALASVGVFHETSPGTFAQTRISEFLRSDIPGSQRHICIANSQPDNWKSFGELEYSVRTGKPSLEHLTGKSFFQLYSADPYYGQAFHVAMTGLSEVHSAAVTAVRDFSGFKKICDVGGGHGHLLGTILERTPTTLGILFDTREVIEAARSAPAKEVLGSRCEFIAGDFFEAVPGGADAYLMKLITHDWDDARAKTILSNVRKVIPPEGRLIVVDAVIAPDNHPSMNKLLDIQMLVGLGGRERTEEEFRSLFAAAGFRLDKVVPTPSPVSIIEGIPQ